MPRLKVRKRQRVFHGKKSWETAKKDPVTAVNRREAQARNDRPNIDTTPVARPRLAAQPRKLKNMSAEKLRNSDFNKLTQGRIITRSLSRKFALHAKLSVEPARPWNEAPRFLHFEYLSGRSGCLQILYESKVKA